MDLPTDNSTENNQQAVSTLQHNYIHSLNDTHKAYTRFFDALLITRSSHRAFFSDLKKFRTQPHVISLLSRCETSSSSSSSSTLTADVKDDSSRRLTNDEVKSRYRQVTQAYLSSCYAHPWCRKALSVSSPYSNDNRKGSKTDAKTSKGWWAADWALTGRKMSKKEAEDEDRLHRLLVPIWIVMRGRMFPGDQVVDGWWRDKIEDEERIARVKELEEEERSEREKIAVRTWLEKVDAVVGEVDIILPSLSLSDTSTTIITSSVDPDTTKTGQEGDKATPSILHKDQDVVTNSAKKSKIPIDLSANPPLNTSKTTPNLRQSFWDSEEASTLSKDLFPSTLPYHSHRQNGSDRKKSNPTNKNGWYVAGYDTPPLSSDDSDHEDEDGMRDRAGSVATTVFKLATAGLLLGSHVNGGSKDISFVQKWKVKKFMKGLEKTRS